MSIRDAQHKLRILYGLFQDEPTPAQVRKWRDRVRALTNQGLSSDDAGDRAAKEILHDQHDAQLCRAARHDSRYLERYR